MKKLIVLIPMLISVALLSIGCGETYSISNAKYVKEVKNQDGSIFLIFKDDKGEDHTLIADNEELISLLSTDSKYNIVVYIGDELTRTNSIKNVVAANR